MRVLILDDIDAYADLLASTCKKLGHDCVVTLDAKACLAALRGQEFDALFVDLDMPTMAGTIFVALVREQGLALPTAICVGNCNDDELVAKAKALGQVLPSIWTHADLRTVLGALRDQESFEVPTEPQGVTPPGFEQEVTMDRVVENINLAAASGGRDDVAGREEATRAAKNIALGTGPIPAEAILGRCEDSQSELRVRTLERSENFVPGAMPGSPEDKSERRRMAPRVHVGCRHWGQVRKLCENVMGGNREITVRAGADIGASQDVVLALKLPDEMVVSMMSEVIERHPPGADGVCKFRLNMVGFCEYEVAYLLDRCAQYQEPQAPSSVAPQQSQPAIQQSPALAQHQVAALHPAIAQPERAYGIPESTEEVDDDVEVPDYAPKISWD